MPAEHAHEPANQEAAREAMNQARETARDALTTIKAMDPLRLTYLGCLAVVVVSTLIFDIASFTVATPGKAVSETVAQAQRDAEALLNTNSISAFHAHRYWGRLMWFSALGGMVLLIWAVVKKSTLAWVPLAQVGLAGVATLCMLLLFAVGFPDLSAFSDASCSATLLGYWVPLLAAAGATFASVKPILGTK